MLSVSKTFAISVSNAQMHIKILGYRYHRKFYRPIKVGSGFIQSKNWVVLLTFTIYFINNQTQNFPAFSAKAQNSSEIDISIISYRFQIVNIAQFFFINYIQETLLLLAYIYLRCYAWVNKSSLLGRLSTCYSDQMGALQTMSK